VDLPPSSLIIGTAIALFILQLGAGFKLTRS